MTSEFKALATSDDTNEDQHPWYLPSKYNRDDFLKYFDIDEIPDDPFDLLPILGYDSLNIIITRNYANWSVFDRTNDTLMKLPDFYELNNKLYDTVPYSVVYDNLDTNKIKPDYPVYVLVLDHTEFHPDIVDIIMSYHMPTGILFEKRNEYRSFNLVSDTSSYLPKELIIAECTHDLTPKQLLDIMYCFINEWSTVSYCDIPDFGKEWSKYLRSDRHSSVVFYEEENDYRTKFIFYTYIFIPFTQNIINGAIQSNVMLEASFPDKHLC